MTDHTSAEYAQSLDARDPLAPLRDLFVYADDTIYLDGNSLGRLPRSTPAAIAHVVEQQWGRDLIRSWPAWMQRATEVSDRLGADVLGVTAGQVALSDSTTVNLYKLADAAVRVRPGRRRILVEADNFPTDLYVLQGIAAARGLELVTVASDPDEGLAPSVLAAQLDEDVALVCLSHVSYRSGALADMVAVTRAVHDVGALMLWDLSHAAGSVPTPLAEAGADLATGCTYKYLNGGPGAPAFLYVRADLQAELQQPIWGWFGQQDQFAMGGTYQPVGSIERFLVGTPPMVGITSVAEGVATVAAAGMPALRAKGVALTTYLIELADAWLTPLGVRLASPRDPDRRGSHVTLHHPQAWQACQALIDRAVVPDFRTPQRLRLGPAPLTTSYAEVREGLAQLRDILSTDAHLAYPAEPAKVT